MKHEPAVVVIGGGVDIQAALDSLRSGGYRMAVAADATEGLALVRRSRPRVVVLDDDDPAADGQCVLAALGEEHPADAEAVVFVTAGDEAVQIRAKLDGARVVVTRPLQRGALLRGVAEAALPWDEERRRAHRRRVASLLARLAELDSGRPAAPLVRLTRLEPTPRRSELRGRDGGDLHLTDNQRVVAGLLASGDSVREVADRLGVSSSNVYATRKRIARKFAVAPAQVGAEAHRRGVASGAVR